MKKTCLYDMHVSLGAKMEEFAGFDMPILYTSITKEHLAVRENVGMFDVSHMGEFLVKGNEAISFVEHIFTNEISSKPFGKVVYGLLLNEQGTVIDDLLVYLVSETEVLLIVNASNIAKDYEWVISQTEGFDVLVSNLSDEYSEIALQGPSAQKAMDECFQIDISNLPFFSFMNAELLGEEVIISRTGYTGEDGFEIYGSDTVIQSLWKHLYDASVTPCGLGARDTLRFEAALPLYGHELSDQVTPLQAGLKIFVKLDKPFIGREALLSQQENGMKSRLVGIELLERNIPRAHYKVWVDDKIVGEITTGYLSISLQKPIALAYLDIDYCKIGTLVEVEIRQKRIKAIVRDKKFLKKNYKSN